MKPLIITVALVMFSFVLFADCYSAWLSAWDQAVNKYNTNVERCNSALSKTRCMTEADAIYRQAVDNAGEDYYHCVL